MRPACAQVYILDNAQQVTARRGLPWGSLLDAQMLSSLGAMLDLFNPFVRRFQFAAAVDDPDLHLRIVATPHLGQQRRYNKAVAPEIALFRPDMEPAMDSTPRDIVLRVRGLQPQLKFISEWNAAYIQYCN